MKSYIDCLNEIDEKELYEGLLARGLFSSKLPPFLSAKEFYDYTLTLSQPFERKESQYINFEIARNINIPRMISIPNPFLYQRLCKLLADNWNNILEHFKKTTSNQTYKVSQIHIRKQKGSSKLFEMNYHNWLDDEKMEPSILIGKQYVVNADISNCFPSIYTHSLAWAFAGREVAKKNRTKHYWYNKIDDFTSKMKEGETHGILIGPVVSNLLSEVILTTIDKELIGKGWEYVRNIDDYTCYVKSYDEAEAFLLALNTELVKFNLSLNHKKTMISSLPLGSVENWVRRLNNHTLMLSNDFINYKVIRSFLDYSIELSNETGNNAVFNYSFKVISKKKLSNNAKEYFVKTAFHLSLLYPYLVGVLEDTVFPFANCDDNMNEFINLLYSQSIDKKRFEAVSYAIYFAIKKDIIIEKFTVEKSLDSNDCIILLLAYYYCKARKNSSGIKKLKKHAEKLNADIRDAQRYWLFIYEVLPKENLTRDWKRIKTEKISFVNFE